MIAMPQQRALRLHAELPEKFRVPRQSVWADLNLGRDIGCFLEGPAFDAHGNLYVVDIPFGRIFRLAPSGDWTLAYEYDGWPNGLKIRSDGQLVVADHRRGLLLIDLQARRHSVVMDKVAGTALLGLNDLAIAADGTIYVTDQGQTGLHDPRGRLLRLAPGGGAETLLDNGPSPNGVVIDGTNVFVAMTRANAVWRVPLHTGRPTKVGAFIQLSGGIGPDGLAWDGAGGLLVAQPAIGVSRFDRVGLPVSLYRAEGETYTTNLAVRHGSIFVTDSINGRILTADLDT